MASVRRAPEIVLPPEERAELEGLASRRKTAQALAMRARVVLASARVTQSKDIAVVLGVCANTVGKWRRRFAALGLDGLYDEPRSGKPRSIDDARIEALIARTLESRPANATHWSSRGMAGASGLSVSSVRRIWRAFGLQPHRLETFKLCWHAHLTPISASWLNQVERFFALITERKMRRGIHKSVAALKADIEAIINAHNANPRPFSWIKSADQILASIERFCLKTPVQKTTNQSHELPVQDTRLRFA